MEKDDDKKVIKLGEALYRRSRRGVAPVMGAPAFKSLEEEVAHLAMGVKGLAEQAATAETPADFNRISGVVDALIGPPPKPR